MPPSGAGRLHSSRHSRLKACRRAPRCCARSSCCARPTARARPSPRNPHQPGSFASAGHSSCCPVMHHRPSPLRTLRAVRVARPLARRRRLGGGQPAIPVLRGTANLPRKPWRICNRPEHCPIAVDADFESFHCRSTFAARTSGWPRSIRSRQRRHAGGRDDRQGRAENHCRSRNRPRRKPKPWPSASVRHAARASASPTCSPRWRDGRCSRPASPICAPAETAADSRILMAGLLADGLNLGPDAQWPRPAASPASASLPGPQTGTSARKPMPWRCGV